MHQKHLQIHIDPQIYRPYKLKLSILFVRCVLLFLRYMICRMKRDIKMLYDCSWMLAIYKVQGDTSFLMAHYKDMKWHLFCIEC